MRIRCFQNDRAAARAVAREIAAALRRKPSLVLGLPTGRTVVPIYDELVHLHQAGRADFRRARTFNLDEFAGLDRRHPSSFRTFMDRHLFSRINLPRRQALVLNGAARDWSAECLRFERAIHAAGGIDLLLLGLGLNGHIGYNEPASALQARTHRARIAAGTRRASAAQFGRLSQVPREALTMGMGTILGARRIVLVATGARKARVVRDLVAGPVTPRLPASFLQLHSNVEIVLDRAAASGLLGRLSSRRS
jgi:glucosamine-6-phosphate deaminase